MVNYNYLDLVLELINGQEVISNHPQDSDEWKYEETQRIQRTMRAIDFYGRNKQFFNKEQQIGLEPLMKEFVGGCFKGNISVENKKRITF